MPLHNFCVFHIHFQVKQEKKTHGTYNLSFISMETTIDPGNSTVKFAFTEHNFSMLLSYLTKYFHQQ